MFHIQFIQRFLTISAELSFILFIFLPGSVQVLDPVQERKEGSCSLFWLLEEPSFLAA